MIGSVPNAELERINFRRSKKYTLGKLDNHFLKEVLEHIYSEYNRKEFIHPDPVEFLFRYDNPCDREIVGMIASSLAYGRVAQILKSVGKVTDKMGVSPRDFVVNSSPARIKKTFAGFKHRFTDEIQLAGFLANIKSVIEKHSSLENAFCSGYYHSHCNVLQALEKFVILLNGGVSGNNYLVPRPSSGSACKRLNLFMKWMVRNDDVDPGGWHKIPPSKLLIPLDTHMWQISSHLGFTSRKQADMKSVLEITDAFKMINPEDPCKYDFALTRLGIRS